MDIRKFLKRSSHNETGNTSKKSKIDELDDTVTGCDKTNVGEHEDLVKQKTCSTSETHDPVMGKTASIISRNRDLGDFLEMNALTNVSDSEKYNFLINPPNPPTSYNFKADAGDNKRSFRCE
jgi:hypothetical protein